ncbi:MAG: type I methionyl aminopeptidase [Planctomycetaceae bacterium]|nr:type I methionyl aminopeptidase [Planctomycetaceae bacterium]
MITLKSEREIALMRKAGLVIWYAHRIAESWVKVGVTTQEIDAVIDRFFQDRDAQPLFKGVPGKVPFPAASCISINEEVVHGIPGARKLVEGDIVSIDTGCRLNGWCADAAETHPVGKISEPFQKLLDVTQKSLQIAIHQLATARYWSEVAREMEIYVKKHRFSVVESLVGHGIGREMHEPPQVPNFISTDLLRNSDFRIQNGLVIAIEPMVNIGSKRVRVGKDHWTFSTIDKKGSAHFEHTIAITHSGPVVLTGPPVSESETIDISPYLNNSTP